MTSAAQVFGKIGEAKPFDGDKDSGERHPKLPPNGKFLLKVLHCELTNGPDCGDCLVIEHEIVESSTPQAMKGQVFATTITHLTGEYSDLKMGKVRTFIAAAFGKDKDDSTQPWTELAMYVTEKDAAAGRLVRAETGDVRKSKSKGRPYLSVDFSQA